MIKYTLECADGHRFDSWFANSDAFETLHGAGQLSCAICGNSSVSKSLMAPALAPDAAPSLSAPGSDAEAAIASMRAELEANSENVGLRFAQEARAMHSGDAPARQIHGEAKPEDAKALIEDGVPVIPLPFLSKSKAN